MIRPPHRRVDRESTILLGAHPRTIEAIEFYDDSVTGQRCHVHAEKPAAQPGLVFDTQEDRNCVRELLLRIEDLESEGKLAHLRKLAQFSNGDKLSPREVYPKYLDELLDALDTVRLKEKA